MEIELKSRGRLRALNNAVAMTVVAVSVFSAVFKIKDENIVEAMQAAKADSLDAWNQYQAYRLQTRLAEQALLMIRPPSPGVAETDEIKAQRVTLESNVAHYEQRAVATMAKAKDFQASYDTLNLNDNQFDLSDACLAISLSLAAVAALTCLWWLLCMSWLIGASGLAMGLAGFMSWGLHPDWLIAFLS
jgi:hypothetical protein